MSVVVTGATGFLGRRLVRMLREDGWRVTCLVRPSSDIGALRESVGSSLWRGVDVQRVDLMDEDRCRDALMGCSVVYHLAAGLSGNPSTLFFNAVVPTRRLMAAALAARAWRFVLVSSLGVYGTHSLKRGAVVDESAPVDPYPHLRDAYTYSKIVQEIAAWDAWRRQGLPLVVVRPGVIIGPGRGVFSSRVGLQLGPLTIGMGGGQQLPYTFVDNCAAAVRQSGLVESIEGEAFNIVDDGLPTAKGLLDMCRQSGQRVRSLWVPRLLVQPLAGTYECYHRWSQGQLPGVITRYRSAALWKPLQYVNDKAKDRLDWRPGIPFDEAFHRSLGSHAATG